MLEVEASLGVELGGKLDKLNRTIKSRMHDEMAISLSGQLVGAGASNTAMISIPGPEGSVEWHLRRITLGQQLNAAAVTAGTIIVGKGLAPTNPSFATAATPTSALQFTEVTRTTTVPNALLMSRTQFVLKYPNNLLIAWVGGSGQLVIDGDCLELQIGNEEDL